MYTGGEGLGPGSILETMQTEKVWYLLQCKDHKTHKYQEIIVQCSRDVLTFRLKHTQPPPAKDISWMYLQGATGNK